MNKELQEAIDQWVAPNGKIIASKQSDRYNEAVAVVERDDGTYDVIGAFSAGVSVQVSMDLEGGDVATAFKRVFQRVDY